MHEHIIYLLKSINTSEIEIIDNKKILFKKDILISLKELKKIYNKEGFIIKGLFGSYSRVKEIENELSIFFKVPVDLADSSGMGKTGNKFIIERTIYV
jgi:uncharacterized protein